MHDMSPVPAVPCRCHILVLSSSGTCRPMSCACGARSRRVCRLAPAGERRLAGGAGPRAPAGVGGQARGRACKQRQHESWQAVTQKGQDTAHTMAMARPMDMAKAWPKQGYDMFHTSPRRPNKRVEHMRASAACEARPSERSSHASQRIRMMAIPAVPRRCRRDPGPHDAAKTRTPGLSCRGRRLSNFAGSESARQRRNRSRKAPPMFVVQAKQG